LALVTCAVSTSCHALTRETGARGRQESAGGAALRAGIRRNRGLLFVVAVSRTHGPQLHVLVDGVVLQVGVVAEVAAHAALPCGALLQQGVLHIKARKCGSTRQNTHTHTHSTA
jgi:hypothetical protein